jgi:hypothetical protein
MCGPVAWSSAQAVPSAQAETQTFKYTDAEQTFAVPEGVHTLQVVAVGGAGGTAGGSTAGGAAARVVGDVEVTPGQTLYVEVGGRGEDSSEGGAGGFNGGAGKAVAGGGGGASDIRTLPRAEPSSLDSRLIVAGGGGGGGGDGPEGAGGAGGAAGSPGGDNAIPPGAHGGGAGTEAKGGAGGEGCNEEGDSGQLGLGGAGGSNSGGGPGGGGGGGYYGGGGGGGACFYGSGGGGGGSSLVPAGGFAETASPVTPPQIQITYTVEPAPILDGLPGGGATPADTILGSHPRKRVRARKKARVSFRFSASVSDVTFECRLDRAPFRPCFSPASYRLKPGRHTFSVRAVTAAGADPSPASFAFRVKRRRPGAAGK